MRGVSVKYELVNCAKAFKFLHDWFWMFSTEKQSSWSSKIKMETHLPDFTIQQNNFYECLVRKEDKLVKNGRQVRFR